MPIYEYRCKKCGNISEFLIGVVQDKVEVKCKHCGSKELNKIFSKSNVSSGRLTAPQGGETCCGSDKRCDTPPCSYGGVCGI